LSKNYLDYVFLVIGADKGVTTNTKTFLKIVLTMNLPIITVITKIDMINEEGVYDIIEKFVYLYKSENKVNPLIVKTQEDTVTFSQNLKENILPIFLVSINPYTFSCQIKLEKV
jgi:elongation factor 1-alpha